MSSTVQIKINVFKNCNTCKSCNFLDDCLHQIKYCQDAYSKILVDC
ncbi:hypothetical protein [Aliarcobacter butzleri]|nr:hypothetical protein [Aliarcobacter butzleri]